MKLGRARLNDGSLVVIRVDGSQVTPIAEGNDPLSVLDTLGRRPGELSGIGPSVALEDVHVLAPIAPPSLRDFVVFEGHLANIGLSTGKPVPPEWYQGPAFYFSNTGAIFGPDDEVRMPRTQKLDFEAELACVIGRDASDLDAADPATLDVIAGFLIFNDLSARDLQAHDQAIGVGPGKGKDFANCIGPWIVTPDEIGGFHEGKTKCAMSATVNGRIWTETSTSDMHYTWGEILAAASVDTTIRRGDVLAAGTCPRGCIAELLNLGEDVHWLTQGDVVEIAADGIGTLRNTIV